MSNFPTLPYVRAGALAVGDCSDTHPAKIGNTVLEELKAEIADDDS